MARPPYPERPPRLRWLLGGHDSWVRILFAGILAGVVIAFVAALIAAAITSSESGPLDPTPTATPEAPAAMRFSHHTDRWLRVDGWEALTTELTPLLQKSRVDRNIVVTAPRLS